MLGFKSNVYQGGVIALKSMMENNMKILYLIIVISIQSQLLFAEEKAEPVLCYQQAQSAPYNLTAEGAIALCGGTRDAHITLECFLQAIATKEIKPVGAVSLCSSNFNATRR